MYVHTLYKKKKKIKYTQNHRTKRYKSKRERMRAEQSRAEQSRAEFDEECISNKYEYMRRIE